MGSDGWGGKEAVERVVARVVERVVGEDAASELVRILHSPNCAMKPGRTRKKRFSSKVPVLTSSLNLSAPSGAHLTA